MNELRRVNRWESPSIHCGWIQAAGLIVSAASAAYSGYSGKKASDAAKDSGEEQAKIEARVTEEEIRQLERDRMRTLGQATTMAASGGVQVGAGSPYYGRQDIESEFDITQAFTEEVGASAAQTAKREAENYGDALFTQSINTAFNQAISLFSI